MVDFGNGSKQGSGFSARGAKRPQTGLQTKDLIALISVIVSLLLVVGCIFYVDNKASAVNFIDRQKPTTAPLNPMDVPDLEQVPGLPNKDAVELWDKNAEWVIKNPEELANQFNGFSSMSFAWLRKQLENDKLTPPNPQYFDVKDIIIDGLPFGTATVVEGLLVNAKTVPVSGLENWQWITLEAENQQFIMVLAPAALEQFTIGNRVTVVGRSMGLIKSPGSEKSWVPLIGARNIAERTETAVVDILGTMRSTLKLGTVDEKELFSDINDERTILELQPYFYLIGKINQVDSYDENVYEDAISANFISGKMHDNPSAYRGQVFQVEGRILDLFTDETVSREKPYGIDNVTRIFMWALVREPFKVTDRSGTVTEKIETVRHTYELAVVGDVPPLAIGQVIRARGRFLKVHGIPLDRSSLRDDKSGKLQSENFYSKFFVVPRIEIVEDETDSVWVKAALSIVMSSFFLCVLWLYFKDIKQSEGFRTRAPRHRHPKKISATGTGSDNAKTESSGSTAAPVTDDETSTSI